MNRSFTIFLSVALASSSIAEPPAVVGPMEHILINYDGQSLDLSFDTNHSPTPNLLDDRSGANYTGAASVLSGRMINDQYGWLANGFIQLGAGEGIWIEAIDIDEGLDVYEGGRRPVRANHTYDAILGTDGSSTIWQWNGLMTHNWYAVDQIGSYEAQYKAYIGDAVTGADLGIASDTITLSFVAVPAPASGAVLALGLLTPRRRRTR